MDERVAKLGQRKPCAYRNRKAQLKALGDCHLLATIAKNAKGPGIEIHLSRRSFLSLSQSHLLIFKRNDLRCQASQVIWDLVIQGADEVIQGKAHPELDQSRLTNSRKIKECMFNVPVRVQDRHYIFSMGSANTGEPCIDFDIMPRMLLYGGNLQSTSSWFLPGPFFTP